MQSFSNLQNIQKFSTLSFLWKHKYLILFLIFTLPLIISTLYTAITTNNYSYPFILLGEKVINADNVIYKDISILNTNPSELFGIKPELGIYRNFLYYLHIGLFIWSISGLIFLISVPFMATYKFFNLTNNSLKLRNIILSLIIGFSFIFIVNMLTTIINLALGNLTMNITESNQFLQILQVIYLTIPFHGIISLVKYLVTLFI